MQNTVFGNFMAGRNLGLQDRARGLAGMITNAQDAQARQPYLAELAGIDPQAANSMKKEFDAQEQEQLKLVSTAFVGADDNQRNQMWPGIKAKWGPRFQALGSDIPDDWKQAMPTIQALAGAGNQNTGVQSTFISGGKLHYLTRDGKPVNTNIEVDDRYTLEIDPQTGMPYRFGSRRGVLEVADGKPQGSPPQTTTPQTPPPAGPGGIVFPEDIAGAAQRTSDVMANVRKEIADLMRTQGISQAEATSIVTQKYARQRGLTMPRQGQQPAPVQQQAPAPVIQQSVPQSSGYRGMSAAEKAAAEAAAKAQVELQYAPQVEAAKLGVQLETAPRLEGAKAEEQAAGKARGERAATGEKRASEAGDAIELLNQAEELLRTATGGYFGAKADEFAAAFGKSTKGAEANAQLNVIAPKLIGLVPRFEGPQSDADRKLYENAAGDLGNPNKPASIRLAAARRMMQLYQKVQQNQPAGNGQQKRIRITL